MDSEAGVWAVTQDMTVSGNIIRLSGCPTVGISEAMFGKWLVTMQCPSGQVLYRDGTGHGKPGLGSAWSPGLGKMRSVAAGPQVI